MLYQKFPAGFSGREFLTFSQNPLYQIFCRKSPAVKRLFHILGIIAASNACVPTNLAATKVASNAYGAPYAKTRNSVCVSDRRETPVLPDAKLGFLDGLSRALVRSAFLIPVSDSNPIKCPMLGMGRPPADKTGGNHTICPPGQIGHRVRHRPQ